MQVLCSRADPASSSQGSQQQQQQPLTARAVLAEAEGLMEEADVTHIKDDEILHNRRARADACTTCKCLSAAVIAQLAPAACSCFMWFCSGGTTQRERQRCMA